MKRVREELNTKKNEKGPNALPPLACHKNIILSQRHFSVDMLSFIQLFSHYERDIFNLF